MAVWLARATEYANNFPLNGKHIRDSSAVKVPRRRGRKRKTQPVACQADAAVPTTVRLVKSARLSALRERTPQPVGLAAAVIWHLLE
eukprot:5224053-Karenia_brevis.AAC.1